MFKLQFMKSIIELYSHYKSNNFSNRDFLIAIDKCFGIKKTTFYDWLNNDDINNAKIIYENKNKLINPAVEKYIVDLFNKNSKIKIKNIKNKINDYFKI